MKEMVHAFAPCKINLHLRVLERRADGFHDIESVFQLVSLADELSVSIAGDDGSCRVVSPLLELPAVNTISRAIDQFRLVTGVAAGISVEVVKKVPAGAGLGGGSSDAASALLALDRLFGTRLPLSVMADLAAKIGSDVPFFLSGSAAIVEGRGEKVSPVSGRTDLFGVLIWPDVHSSTAEAYRLVDDWQAGHKADEPVWPSVSVLADMYHGPVSAWTFGNSFTAPLEAAYPVIREARLALRDCGALYAEMSGSGSSVFGLFPSSETADAAQKKLSSRWSQCVKFLLLAS